MNTLSCNNPQNEIRFGFVADLEFGLAGVSMTRERQHVLRVASSLVNSQWTLAKGNDGIRIAREPGNPYDPDAVQVWLATQIVNSQFAYHQMAGYIPRRVCTNCFKTLGAKDKDALQCMYCYGPLNGQPMSWTSRFISAYLDKGVWPEYAVYWIKQSEGVDTWGCRVAFKFPPAKLEPPNVSRPL